MEMEMEWELVMDEDEFVQVKKLDDHHHDNDLPSSSSSTFNLVHLNYFICPPDQIDIPIPTTKPVVDDHEDEMIHTHNQVQVKKLKETEFVDKPAKVNNVSEGDSETERGNSSSSSSDNDMKNQVLRWMGGICTFGVAAVAILVCNQQQQQHHRHMINYSTKNHRMRMAKKMKKGSRSGKGMKNIDEGGGFRVRQARISFGGYCNASL